MTLLEKLKQLEQVFSSPSTPQLAVLVEEIKKDCAVLVSDNKRLRTCVDELKERAEAAEERLENVREYGCKGTRR